MSSLFAISEKLKTNQTENSNKLLNMLISTFPFLMTQSIIKSNKCSANTTYQFAYFKKQLLYTMLLLRSQ